MRFSLVCLHLTTRLQSSHPEEILGVPFWTNVWWAHPTLPPEVAINVHEGFRTALKGEFWRTETRAYTSAGELYLDFSLNPVFEPVDCQNKKVIFVVAEGRDITEKRRVEQELQRKNSELTVQYPCVSPASLSTLTCLLTETVCRALRSRPASLPVLCECVA